MPESGIRTTPQCKHPKEKRSLLDGYEVVCECGETIGRVALHGNDVVFSRAEAKRLLGFLGDAGENSNERGKLVRAASLRGPSRPLPAPGMTDLMVTPESIDAYLAENPPPRRLAMQTPDPAAANEQWQAHEKGEKWELGILITKKKLR